MKISDLYPEVGKKDISGKTGEMSVTSRIWSLTHHPHLRWDKCTMVLLPVAETR